MALLCDENRDAGDNVPEISHVGLPELEGAAASPPGRGKWRDKLILLTVPSELAVSSDIAELSGEVSPECTGLRGSPLIPPWAALAPLVLRKRSKRR